MDELKIYNDETVKEGDRVWDYDIDLTRQEGELFFNKGAISMPKWMVQWDDGECTYVLNPSQLHKI